MASIKFPTIVLLLLVVSPSCQAGILDHLKKKSHCDETCETTCGTDSRPAIERPCVEIVRTYQRGFATPPGSCDTCTPAGCVPGGQPCCWPAPSEGCDASCTGSDCDGRCDSDLAALITDSKTNCHASHRRAAVHKIGTHYCCKACPQVMPALVYALNDTDECVRAKAADKIGDQLRNNPCCCAPYVLCALKLSLADCDQCVRIQAEQALIACGYRIVDPRTACTTSCVSEQCATAAATPASAVEPATPPKLTAVKGLLRKLSIAPASPVPGPPESESPETSPQAFAAAAARPIPIFQEMAPVPPIQNAGFGLTQSQPHELETAQTETIFTQPLLFIDANR